jgi:dTDP-4-amino-4,6-dideoxygalactose transaminase
LRAIFGGAVIALTARRGLVLFAGMITVPFLDLKTQSRALRNEIFDALGAVFDSASFAQGPVTEQFEAEFARYCGVQHCVSLNSGTSALHLALRCLDIGPGDEVITTPLTFIATAWAISYVGARPVFVDIDAARRTLDPAKLEAAITPRTRAILPVHLYGMPAAMDAICQTAARHGIPVVEDAAQAHGARLGGRRVGQFGVIACFSFYPTKNLGACGEGGALTTNDAAIAARARALRNHSQSRRYEHDEIGYNYRMDSFQAAVLRVKLKHLDAWNAARAAHAGRYCALLADAPVGLPRVAADCEPVWHAYVIEADGRDRLQAALARAGIGAAVYYPLPLHRQKPYLALGYRDGDFPVAETFSQRCLALPMYPELTDGQIEWVAASLRQAL